MPLQIRHDTDRLRVVVKSTIGRHCKSKRILACVTKGRVAKIMRQSDRFRQFLIEAQCARDCPRDLRHFDRMS